MFSDSCRGPVLWPPRKWYVWWRKSQVHCVQSAEKLLACWVRPEPLPDHGECQLLCWWFILTSVRHPPLYLDKTVPFGVGAVCRLPEKWGNWPALISFWVVPVSALWLMFHLNQQWRKVECELESSLLPLPVFLFLFPFVKWSLESWNTSNSESREIYDYFSYSHRMVTVIQK